MAKGIVHNIGPIGKKPSTFKFLYSAVPVTPYPQYVPREKPQSELVIGWYFGQLLSRKMKRNIEGIKLNNDDSNKQADVIMFEDGRSIPIQVTRLTFTEYETRKAFVKTKSLEFAKKIDSMVRLDSSIVVSIFPKEKDKIPLSDLKKGEKIKIEKKLIKYLIDLISENKTTITGDESSSVPVYVVNDSELKNHFAGFDLSPIPKGHFTNVWGHGKININYDFYNSSYDQTDEDNAIEHLFKSKNGGFSDILLIWVNEFEVHNLKGLVDKLQKRFWECSFKRVYLMSFNDNWEFFHKTLRLWLIHSDTGTH